MPGATIRQWVDHDGQVLGPDVMEKEGEGV